MSRGGARGCAPLWLSVVGRLARAVGGVGALRGRLFGQKLTRKLCSWAMCCS